MPRASRIRRQSNRFRQLSQSLASSEAPAPAATRDLALQAPIRAMTGRTSAWLTALLALGAVVLLSAPVAFVRRRKQQAAAEAGAPLKSLPRQLVDPIAGIDVVEARLPSAPSDGQTASIGRATVEPVKDSGAVVPADLDDIAVHIGPIDAVDLDVGAPVVMNERVDWFAHRADAESNCQRHSSNAGPGHPRPPSRPCPGPSPPPIPYQ